VLLVVGALALAGFRPRGYGRTEAAVLMLVGFVSMGASEFVREGIRKPWVIDRYMFVNSVRLPASANGAVLEDPFSIDSLQARGVLPTARFAAVPAGYRPGTAEFDGLEPEARAALEAEAGAEVFRLQCTACHTVRAHLGVRRLVEGQSVAALEGVLDSMAHPLDADGEATTWDDPALRLETRLERRMPPFVGTDAEKRALAVYLARLGGDSEAGIAELAGDPGAEAFEVHCAACHGPESPWPMSDRLGGRSPTEFFDLIGRLDEVREEMAPFAGSEEEREALADYLGALAAEASGEEVTS
jgi:mono/diheme cytochrome c family protein